MIGLLMKNNPILITGMHRSGTTVLSKILSRYIYFGSKLDENNESIYYQRINRWMLSCNSCSWDNPISFNELSRKDIDILVSNLNKTLKNKILYFLLYSGFRGLNNSDSKWGWKDPVNIFTIHIWKHIFDNIKVVNLIRNPIDVANSLMHRQKKLSLLDQHFISKNRFLSYLPLLSINKGNLLSSFRIKNINDCLLLYIKYYDQMRLNNDSKLNVIDVRFENLLNNTEIELQRIYEFCNISNKFISDDIKLINLNNINFYDRPSDFNKDYLDLLPKSINYEK
tara:strand:+ start:383 stop:1228 length:846 start_codon:yes stop_codon:yes gene_type:complete